MRKSAADGICVAIKPAPFGKGDDLNNCDITRQTDDGLDILHRASFCLLEEIHRNAKIT